MLKGLYLLAFLAGLATAAIQPSGPVYRSASAVNAPSLKQQNQQLPLAQPAAEERESTSFQAAESNVKSTVGTSPTANTAQVTPQTPNPQHYTVLYYPNTQIQGQQQQPQQGYPNTVTSAGVYQQPGVDFWTKYRMNDVLVGGAVLALVLGGGSILYPKLVNVRARALRELSELKAEDANRMMKGVMRAIQKFSEMNAKE